MDGDGSHDEDLLYTFKCAPLILFTTTVFPSKLARQYKPFPSSLDKRNGPSHVASISCLYVFFSPEVISDN